MGRSRPSNLVSSNHLQRMCYKYVYFYVSLSLLPFSLSSLFTVRFTCVDIVRAYIDFRNARVQREFGYYRRCYTVIRYSNRYWFAYFSIAGQ